MQTISSVQRRQPSTSASRAVHARTPRHAQHSQQGQNEAAGEQAPASGRRRGASRTRCNWWHPAVIIPIIVRRRGVTQRGVRRGAVKRGARRKGMGKKMVMILELRKTRRQNQCQLMYNVQWMTEFSRTRLSLIFLSALGQKLC